MDKVNENVQEDSNKKDDSQLKTFENKNRSIYALVAIVAVVLACCF